MHVVSHWWPSRGVSVFQIRYPLPGFPWEISFAYAQESFRSILADLATFCSNSTNSWCLSTFHTVLLFTSADRDFEAIQTDIRQLEGVLDRTGICNQSEVCQFQMGESSLRGPDLQAQKDHVTSRAGSLEWPVWWYLHIIYLKNSWFIREHRLCSWRDTVFGWLSWMCSFIKEK